MCIRQRLSVTAFRSIRFLLNVNHKNQCAIVHDISSTSSLACRYSTKSLFRCPDYVINNKSNATPINKCVSLKYSTDTKQTAIPIVTYEEVKDLPNHPGKKWLIDVREPDELKETGVIPTAINIPLGEVNAAFNMKANQFQAKYNCKKPNSNDEIIFHCKIGKRSENAAIIVSKLGYTNAKNYLGSFTEWAEKEGLSK